MSTEVICESLSEKWFQTRLGKMGGTRIKKLMPTDQQLKAIAKAIAKAEKKNEPLELPFPWSDGQLTILRDVAAEILTGEREETFTNKAMQWGTDNEPNARRAFEDKEMVVVRECGIYVYNDYVAVSPDGDIEDNKESWEAKCPTSKQHLLYYLDSNILYDDYKWQTIAECWAMEYKKGVICSYDPRFPDDKQLVIHRFEPTAEEFKALEDRLIAAVQLIKEWIGEKPIDTELPE